MQVKEIGVDGDWIDYKRLDLECEGEDVGSSGREICMENTLQGKA